MHQKLQHQLRAIGRSIQEGELLWREPMRVPACDFRHANDHRIWSCSQMKLEFNESGYSTRILGSSFDVTDYQAVGIFAAKVVRADAHMATTTAEGNYEKQT